MSNMYAENNKTENFVEKGKALYTSLLCLHISFLTNSFTKRLQEAFCEETANIRVRIYAQKSLFKFPGGFFLLTVQSNKYGVVGISYDSVVTFPYFMVW